MQNKQYIGLTLFLSVLSLVAVFIFSSDLSAPSGFLGAVSSNWIDQTGAGISAPACGSSTASVTCNGSSPRVTFIWDGKDALANPDVTIDVRIGSASWINLVSGKPASGSFDWDGASLNTAYQYRIRYNSFHGGKRDTLNTGSFATPAVCIALTQCSDAVDNADPEDILVDMADPGCSSPSDDDESDIASFNFGLSNGGAKAVTQGNAVQNIITASLMSGNSESVGFSASGLPADTTFSFSIPSCNPTCSTTLTINTTFATPVGNYLITVSGANSSGLTKITQFNLNVNQAPPCADGQDNDNDGFTDFNDPSCGQSGGGTEYSECNDKNADGSLRDNDGDGIANIFDPGCHSDGNPNNPATYNPNDNDESNTIFQEVFTPFENLVALLFKMF